MKQLIATRFTRKFGVDHPVMLAPMDLVSGGRLAAAVTDAGGLGIIGGGYGDPDWVDQAFAAAGNQPVGVGFITWSVLQTPEVIDAVLTRRPAALMTSFGDAEPMVSAAREAGIPSIWQVQTLAQARQAQAAGTDVIVVQGQEAGGHGMNRGLVSLLPAVRDLTGPDQILLAAGGLADGRGLAGALMLGADGVMMGTRFWASVEADGADSAKAAVTAAEGDRTIRSGIFDIARQVDWPKEYSGRVLANDFSDRWRDDVEGLKANAAEQNALYEASAPDDYATRVVIAGEAVDLIEKVEPAREIVHRTVREAADLLQNAQNHLV